MQKLIRKPLVIAIRLTGYRFSKEHRHNNSMMYRIFDTTMANIEADQ